MRNYKLASKSPRTCETALKTNGIKLIRYITSRGTKSKARLLETHPDRLYVCNGGKFFNIDPATRRIIKGQGDEAIHA